MLRLTKYWSSWFRSQCSFCEWIFQIFTYFFCDFWPIFRFFCCILVIPFGFKFQNYRWGLLNLSLPDLSEICKYLSFVSPISVIFIQFWFRIIPVGFCDVSSFFLLHDWIVSYLIFRNIPDPLGNEPLIPERDWMAEQECSHI